MPVTVVAACSVTVVGAFVVGAFVVGAFVVGQRPETVVKANVPGIVVVVGSVNL